MRIDTLNHDLECCAMLRGLSANIPAHLHLRVPSHQQMPVVLRPVHPRFGRAAGFANLAQRRSVRKLSKQT